MKKQIPKIILVDDHEIFRFGIKSLILQEHIADVIGEASDGQQFLDLLKIKKPDVVLMDISMPVMDGIEATKIAIEKYPDMNILVLSMFGEETYYYSMINAGAKGFLLKTTSREELETAIDTVVGGDSYFSKELLRKIVVSLNSAISDNEEVNMMFSQAELEVLKLICSGKSFPEISDSIGESQDYVEKIHKTLINKTGAKSTISLIMFAIEKKLVSL